MNVGQIGAFALMAAASGLAWTVPMAQMSDSALTGREVTSRSDSSIEGMASAGSPSSGESTEDDEFRACTLRRSPPCPTTTGRDFVGEPGNDRSPDGSTGNGGASWNDEPKENASANGAGGGRSTGPVEPSASDAPRASAGRSWDEAPLGTDAFWEQYKANVQRCRTEPSSSFLARLVTQDIVQDSHDEYQCMQRIYRDKHSDVIKACGEHFESPAQVCIATPMQGGFATGPAGGLSGAAVKFTLSPVARAAAPVVAPVARGTSRWVIGLGAAAATAVGGAVWSLFGGGDDEPTKQLAGVASSLSGATNESPLTNGRIIGAKRGTPFEDTSHLETIAPIIVKEGEVVGDPSRDDNRSRTLNELIRDSLGINVDLLAFARRHQAFNSNSPSDPSTGGHGGESQSELRRFAEENQSLTGIPPLQVTTIREFTGKWGQEFEQMQWRGVGYDEENPAFFDQLVRSRLEPSTDSVSYLALGPDADGFVQRLNEVSPRTYEGASASVEERHVVVEPFGLEDPPEDGFDVIHWSGSPGEHGGPYTPQDIIETALPLLAPDGVLIVRTEGLRRVLPRLDPYQLEEESYTDELIWRAKTVLQTETGSPYAVADVRTVFEDLSSREAYTYLTWVAPIWWPSEIAEIAAASGLELGISHHLDPEVRKELDAVFEGSRGIMERAIPVVDGSPYYVFSRGDSSGMPTDYEALSELQDRVWEAYVVRAEQLGDRELP